jgi:hypothetical protein
VCMQRCVALHISCTRLLVHLSLMTSAIAGSRIGLHAQLPHPVRYLLPYAVSVSAFGSRLEHATSRRPDQRLAEVAICAMLIADTAVVHHAGQSIWIPSPERTLSSLISASPQMLSVRTAVAVPVGTTISPQPSALVAAAGPAHSIL